MLIQLAWYGAEEHHQDGGRHWHALLIFHTALRTRNKDCFNIEGRHPNIKVVKGSRLDFENI